MRHTKTMLLALGMVMPGCALLGLNCTEMGCAGTLSVWMDGALVEGPAYEVVVEGFSAEPCAFSLPLRGYEDCASIGADGQLVVSFFLPMGAAPDEVTLVLLEDGEEAARTVDRPSYGAPYYPNGEACDGGGCRSGEATFLLLDV